MALNIFQKPINYSIKLIFGFLFFLDQNLIKII